MAAGKPEHPISATSTVDDAMITVRIPIAALKPVVTAVSTPTAAEGSSPALTRSMDLDAVQFAKYILSARDMRSDSLPGLELGEPTWNMLLHLFVSEAEGYRINVSNACDASGVPPTTALRHLERLVQQQHVVREEDPVDRRRVYVRLSRPMRDRIEDLMSRTVAKLRQVLSSSAPRPFYR